MRPLPTQEFFKKSSKASDRLTGYAGTQNLGCGFQPQKWGFHENTLFPTSPKAAADCLKTPEPNSSNVVKSSFLKLNCVPHSRSINPTESGHLKSSCQNRLGNHAICVLVWLRLLTLSYSLYRNAIAHMEP